MLRREFSLACGAVAGAGWLPAGALAQGKAPQAGTDFLVLEQPAGVEAPAGKIEVVEFFWYSCGHCNSFEPTLESWIKQAPKDMAVRRVPVAFQDSFVPQQRLYYTLEAMGLVDKLHAKVFAALHVDKLPLARADQITEWVAKQGVDKAKFTEQFNSFSVATKASRATRLQNAYRVEGVPALGIAGRFYTDGSLAKTMGRALQIAEFLVAGVRAGR